MVESVLVKEEGPRPGHLFIDGAGVAWLVACRTASHVAVVRANATLVLTVSEYLEVVSGLGLKEVSNG